MQLKILPKKHEILKNTFNKMYAWPVQWKPKNTAGRN